MARDEAVIDISAMPDVVRLVEQAERSHMPLRLERGDEVVAVLTPRRAKRRRERAVKPLTEEQRAMFLSSAGGWQGLVDAEQLKRDIKAARGQRRRRVEV